METAMSAKSRISYRESSSLYARTHPRKTCVFTTNTIRDSTMWLQSLLSFALALPVALGHQHQAHSASDVLSQAFLSINGIPYSTRAHWMRQANAALADVGGDPCPFGAFGTVIVNHTVPGLGELVCMGANSNRVTGDPTLHGKLHIVRFRLRKSSMSSHYTNRRDSCDSELQPYPHLARWTLQPYQLRSSSRLFRALTLHQCRIVPHVCFCHPLGGVQGIHIRHQHRQPYREGLGSNPHCIYRSLPREL